jgi:hypothetical protein
MLVNISGTKPPSPISLIADGDTFGVSIDLIWESPISKEIFATEIWSNTVNNRSTATLVSIVIGNTFSHVVAKNSTHYYWIRNVSIFQKTPGDFFPVSSTAGIEGKNKEITVMRGPAGASYTGNNTYQAVATAYGSNTTKFNTFVTLFFTGYVTSTDSSTSEFKLDYWDFDEEVATDSYGPIIGTHFVSFSRYVKLPANMGELAYNYAVRWKGSSANIELKNPLLSIIQSY